VNKDVAIAILAAGEARRFGGGKLDARIAGRPLGRFAVDSALAANLGRPSIVVSPAAPDFAVRAADEGLVDLLVNSRPDAGIATSIAVAARSAAETGRSGLLLMLADMPLVSPGSLERLAAAVAYGRPSAVRHADARAGIPACFPRDMFEALQRLHGDRGAAALLRASRDVAVVEIDPSELRDVDTPGDLVAVEALLS
jgi:CTP:molybdopterin cytidylyltransferase MocA